MSIEEKIKAFLIALEENFPPNRSTRHHAISLTTDDDGVHLSLRLAMPDNTWWHGHFDNGDLDKPPLTLVNDVLACLKKNRTSGVPV